MPSDMPIRINFGNWTNFLRQVDRTPLKFIPSLNGITRKGTRNLKRKRVVTGGGYIELFEPSHPLAKKNGYVLEHRKVIFGQTGRTLLPNEQIHHINGDKTDNRAENLQIIMIDQHTSYHHKGKTKPRKPRENPELLTPKTRKD